ncbi:MAG: hypothetical protein K2X32_09235 [Phycisphaerales bacterium]|nr:hypothetical protein [Phycisphaerales bacterium]
MRLRLLALLLVFALLWSGVATHLHASAGAWAGVEVAQGSPDDHPADNLPAHAQGETFFDLEDAA